MTEWTKTLSFVAAAVVTAGLAAVAQTLVRPAAAVGFERVGDEFYPEFDDPTAAKSLRLVSYDEATSIIKPFEVTFEKGRYRISPYGYPADAEDQLAKTAASVVGVRREALASRRETDHERFGVIDPLSDDPAKLAGRGRRVTLKDAKGAVLADFIVGKAVEGSDGFRYVRLPKEKETYRAKVDLNLTTRFADWIKAELLDVAAADLRKIEIRDYSVDEDRGRIAGRDLNVLSRTEGFGPWTLEGLNAETEQVASAEVNKLVRVLDDLKIVGVRPKPPGLNPDLTLDQAAAGDLQALATDLRRRGFLLLPAEGGGLAMIAKEGQLTATTDDGVVYDLFFGDVFTGSEYELEFGEGAGKSGQPKRLGDERKVEPQKGRYVFVAARFEPATLGDPPQPPSDSQGEGEAVQAAKTEYEAAKKAHEGRVADAKKKVDDLNERFKEWYYVISTESFTDLRLSRDSLVEPKAATPPTSPATPPAGPSAGSTDAAPAGESRPPVEAAKP